MSSSPYFDKIGGAAPITGTGTATVLVTPPEPIDDTDVDDEWAIHHVSEFINHSGEPVDFQFDLLGDGLLLHRNTFMGIGSDDDTRIFEISFMLAPVTTSLAFVSSTATLSGSGEVGPNSRIRSTATLDAPFNITDLTTAPITLDLKVTLGSSDAEYVFSPVRTRIHKVEPVLSAGVGGGNVQSVNTQTGVVVLTAAHVGAAASTQIGTPIVHYNRTGTNTGKYNARPTSTTVDYEGPVEPTTGNCLSPPFQTGDFWRRTTS